VLRYLFVVMLLLLSAVPAVPGPAAPEFAPSYFDDDGDGVDDRLIPLLARGEAVNIFLVFDTKPGDAQRQALASLGLAPSYESHYLPVWQLDDVPAHKVSWLAALPDLRLVEWQAIYYPLLDKSVRAIKARDSSTYDQVAWDRGLDGDGIVIAVLDTGVDNEHETFEGRFIAGVDCVSGCGDHTTEEDSGGDPDDRNGHGTHTASTALGTGGETDEDSDGEPDYMGVAPGARLVDVKVMTDIGAGGNVLQGIEWCTEHADEDWDSSGSDGIQVMSMSVGTSGGSDGSDSVSQAANTAVAAGIVAVAAMGNDGDNVVPAPAAGDLVIAVGATENPEDNVDRNDDLVASYSNYGPRDSDGDEDRWDELKPDVVAPGSDIHAAAGAPAPFTIATDGYTTMDGTSMACPHVAGLAALMLQDDPELEPGSSQNEMMWRMRNFSEPWGAASEPDNSSKYNYYSGWGYVDAWEFVNVAQPDGKVSVLSSDPAEPIEGDDVTLSITIENVGDAVLEDAHLELYADSNELEAWNLPDIDPDGELTRTKQWSPTEGEYTLRAKLFADNDENGGNDELELTVSVGAPPQGVDLELAALTAEPNTPVHNEQVKLTATVVNQGEESADRFSVRFYDAGGVFATVDGPALDPESDTVVETYWQASDGNHTLRAEVFDIEPADQHTANNDYELELEVAPPPEEPDFAPAVLALQGELLAGEALDISFSVRNLGQTDGEVDVTLKLDGNVLENWDSQMVDAGAEVLLYTEWDAEVGDHRLDVQLSGASPQEASVDNNQLELDFNIAALEPQFSVTSIDHDATLTQGVATTIIVTVANDGSAVGSVELVLDAESTRIGVQTVEIGAGTTKDVVFDWTPANWGPKVLIATAVDSSLSKSVWIFAPVNQPPLAVAQVAVVGGAWMSGEIMIETGLEVSFSGEGSSDPDGEDLLLEYAWSIVDQNGVPFSLYGQQDAQSFTTTFNVAGTYTATLTVNDEYESETAMVSVVVISTPVTTTPSGSGGNDSDWLRSIGTLLFGLVVLAAGALALNRMRREEDDDDYFDDIDGPLQLTCPACQGSISVATPQRPVQLGCPHCQAQFVLRE
jgi:subtilisin family serine protease